MLTKALEEVAKKLIEKILAARHGWAALLLFTFVVGGYFTVRELRATPDATAALSDPRFLTVIWIAATAAVIYAVWHLPTGRTRRLVALVLVAVASTVSWWNVVELEPPPLRIDVVFDPGAGLSTELAADFFATLTQAKTILVTVLDKRVPNVADGDRIVFENAKTAFLPHLRSNSQTTHTALITSKQLSGSGWSNLFYNTSPRFSVISTFGILPVEEKERRVLLRKYLASMVPLAAMHGQALGAGKKLLNDRDPATEHGCLHDFSADKLLLMEKLKRGPKLCAVEDAEISKVFGSGMASEYRSILAAAGAAGAPSQVAPLK